MNNGKSSFFLDEISKKAYPESLGQLDSSIQAAKQTLLSLQESDGHWCYNLEADCTITAEYILMMHFMDEIDIKLEQKLAAYLREHQNSNGGWSLYPGAKPDISGSVKAYYALKLSGDDPNLPHMQKARQLILELGGAARSNVFTRITLALFKQVPWRAVPFMPVEALFFPRWFPFHLQKIAYWSRTVMVPLLVICSLKAQAKNPKKIDIAELFITPPEQEKAYYPIRSKLNYVFLLVDAIARNILEPMIPRFLRKRALKKAIDWIIPRLNGEDGLGCIFPAMVNAYEALALLGYGKDDPLRKQALHAMQKLLVLGDETGFCQPCVSPVWDTGLMALALQEEGSQESLLAANKALDWLKPLQILDGDADWKAYRPNLAPGGWAFEYYNPYYPDLDDTAVVAWAMFQSGKKQEYQFSIERAVNWLSGMQSKNGGFASFDADNTHYYLNEIPFADHGALLDPPTSDVSARCATLFAFLQRPQDQNLLQRCLNYLLSEQEEDGSWYGRWGTNYIYGTWSVLTALSTAGISREHPKVQAAISWLKSRQQEDGGWGENNDSYFDKATYQQPSTAAQTSWALLGLMAFGEHDSAAVQRGVNYLLRTQRQNGVWIDHWFNAPGFPKVFYLKYHGYSQYFPFWTLCRFRNLIKKH